MAMRDCVRNLESHSCAVGWCTHSVQRTVATRLHTSRGLVDVKPCKQKISQSTVRLEIILARAKYCHGFPCLIPVRVSYSPDS